jgi:hypothetical protein
MTADNIVTLGAGDRGWYAASRDDCQKVGECRPQGDKPAHASPADAKRSHPSALLRWVTFRGVRTIEDSGGQYPPQVRPHDARNERLHARRQRVACRGETAATSDPALHVTADGIAVAGVLSHRSSHTVYFASACHPARGNIVPSSATQSVRHSVTSPPATHTRVTPPAEPTASATLDGARKIYHYLRLSRQSPRW